MSDDEKTTTRNRKKGYYAVRGGVGEGIYQKWGDAVNAGFQFKAPRGNAVKFDTKKEAEDWMRVKPFPENSISVFAKNGETWISKQHFLVKINVLFFFGILVFTCFFKGCVFAQEKLQCDSTVMMTSVLCLNLNKFKVALAENLAQFIDIVFYWVIFALGVFTTWMSGFLN